MTPCCTTGRALLVADATVRAAAAPGSVAQVRAAAHELVTFAKRRGTAVILVGHVTKEGQIAGPKQVEHLVDAVLYFEGDSSHTFRILRGVKNRYGATDEIGVFEVQGSAPGRGTATDKAYAVLPTICFEVAYDGLIRDSVAAAGSTPSVLLVQTNNATFGFSAESEQQFALSRIRLSVSLMSAILPMNSTCANASNSARFSAM